MNDFPSIEEVQNLLEEITEEIPKELFKELNKGIILLPQYKLHTESRAGDKLYIMGQYVRDFSGRHIVIYYGSYKRVYNGISRVSLREKLKDTLLHEFTHHLESLAGEKGLIIKDKALLKKYRDKKWGDTLSRILVVDDEEKIREVIREYAEFQGYEVEEAQDGITAINLCKEKNFDMIIMDIMMPKLDGYAAVKEIRKMKDIPVLMLSARSDEYDKLYGFDLGIDDYVIKPFSPRELMARINVIISRNKKVEEHNKLIFDGLKIDLDAMDVFINDEKIELTPKEYELVTYMAKNKNIALSREKLLNEVWGYDFFGDYRTIDTHIKMLRNSLKEYRSFIKTIRGVGYKFEYGD